MFRLSPLAVLLLSLQVTAADIDLKPVYLQSVPHSQVHIDRRGKAWFADKDGLRDETNKVACKELKGHLLLADSAGRFWFRDQYDSKKSLTYFDGKGWTETGVFGHEAFEDSAGRVIVRTASGFAVFDGKKWAKSATFGKDVGDGLFVEDPAGRVWYHLYRTATKRPLADGVWLLDGDEWKPHDPPGREKGEYVESFIPFADDWFLVLVKASEGNGRNIHWPRAFPWSPSRTADDIAKAKPFAGLPDTLFEYRDRDHDGVRYFRTLGDNDPAWQKAPGYPPAVAISPKGEVRHLTEAEGTKLARPAHLGYSLGTTDPAAAVPVDVRNVIGRDLEGRIYFGHTAADRIWAVWPKHEKPTDCLRPTAYPPASEKWRSYQLLYSGLFADSAGTAFAITPGSNDGVSVWDGKAEKWTDTPIKALPLAHWYARPAPPPEYGWANVRAVGHVAGSGGLTLFVRLTTKYAPETEAKENEFRNHPPKRPAADDPFYIYEGWLHAGGKWSEVVEPGELILTKRKELLAELTVPHTPMGPLPVISNGQRLWFARDWKVSTLDADGVVHSADLPKPEVKEPADPREKLGKPLMLAAFAKQDERSFVLLVAWGSELKTYSVRFFAGKGAKVAVEDLGPLPAGGPTLQTAADGTVLAWGNDPARGVGRLSGGKWLAVEGVCAPVGVAGNGDLWCPPLKPTNDPDWKTGKTVLYRVRGEKAERYAWGADELATGFGKPADGAAVFPDSQLGIVCLEPSKAGEKPTLRVRHTPPLRSVGQVAVTASGHLLMPHEHGRLFDPKAK